jgi:hypothetical protein
MNLTTATGIPASAAGISLAQVSGSDIDRAKTITSAQQRTSESETRAEKAAGIGETDGEDHMIEDRDADGRQAWDPGSGIAAPPPSTHESPESEMRQGRDPSGNAGSGIDITG